MELLGKFFSTIIPVSLDEPTHATIELKGNSRGLSAIVVPRIDSEGRFVFAFYDAVQSFDGNAHSREDMAFPITVRFRNGQGIETILADVEENILLSDKKKRLSGQLIVVQPEVNLTDNDIVYADFCVEEFPLFFGALTIEKTEISDSEVVYGGRSRILGRSTFESHGWRFTISECPDKNEMGITHSGSIARGDGDAFSVRQLKDVIDGLTYFLRGCFQSIEFVLTYMHDTKTIPQRPNRRTVGCSSSPTPSSQARGTTTYSGPAGGAQRHLVCASERMPMADAPARSAPLADSVQILPQVDDGWNVGKSP